MEIKHYTNKKQSLLLIIASIVSLIVVITTACTPTSHNNKPSAFAITDYQPIPYPQLANFNVTIETSGEATNPSAIDVTVFRQRGINSAQSKRLLVTSINNTISLNNSTLLPPARFVRPHITLIYNAPQPIMRVSMLIGDYDATLTSDSPPMRLVDYEYIFIDKTWILHKYTYITHYLDGKEPDRRYINHEESIDLTNNERIVKRQNQITKTTFRHTTAISLADSLGYRIAIDSSREGSNVLLEKLAVW